MELDPSLLEEGSLSISYIAQSNRTSLTPIGRDLSQRTRPTPRFDLDIGRWIDQFDRRSGSRCSNSYLSVITSWFPSIDPTYHTDKGTVKLARWERSHSMRGSKSIEELIISSIHHSTINPLHQSYPIHHSTIHHSTIHHSTINHLHQSYPFHPSTSIHSTL